MLPVVWLPSALEDLSEIIQFIAEINPAAARRLKSRLQDILLPISEHPYLYRQSDRVDGLREIVAHPNYIIFYRVSSSAIEVVSVVHSRRQYPK